MSLLDQFKGSAGVLGAFNRNSQPGDEVTGKITLVEVQQVREYVPGGIGDLLFFDDGKPKMQVVITVDTGIVDTAVEEDDGLRRIYVRMDYKSQREALFAAVQVAGDDDVRVGGDFTARYDGKPEGWNVYSYSYRKPSALAAAAMNGASHHGPQGQVGPQVPQTAPVAPPAPPAAPVVDSPPPPPMPSEAEITAAKAMLANGVPAEVVAQTFATLTPEVIAALKNLA